MAAATKLHIEIELYRGGSYSFYFCKVFDFVYFFPPIKFQPTTNNKWFRRSLCKSMHCEILNFTCKCEDM